jgi:hypothetical protein
MANVSGPLRSTAEFGVVTAPALALVALPFLGWVDERNAAWWFAGAAAWFVLSLITVAVLRQRRAGKSDDGDQAIQGNVNVGGTQINAPIAGTGHTVTYNLGNPRPDRHMPMSILAMGDGETEVFHTTTAYKPGTLSVQVDGLGQIGIELDPRRGTFRYPFVPSVGMTIMASWTVDQDAPPLDNWRTARIRGVDGERRTFRTPTPYAPNSLNVIVDGQAITSLTETNPATGLFDLEWAPDADETVTARWQLRS